MNQECLCTSDSCFGLSVVFGLTSAKIVHFTDAVHREGLLPTTSHNLNVSVIFKVDGVVHGSDAEAATYDVAYCDRDQVGYQKAHK